MIIITGFLSITIDTDNSSNKKLHKSLKIVSRALFASFSVYILLSMFIFVDNVIPEGNSLPEEPSVPELSPVFSSKSIGYEEETVSFSYNQLPTQILDDIFPISLNIFSHQESELEKVLLLKEYIKEDIDSRIGSEADIEFTILNSSNEWIQYTEEANKIKINNEDCIEDYLRRIVLRESAYDIGKTRDLCLIIATDYYDLGKAYAKQNDKEVAMDNYIKAIKYYKDSFNMKTEKGQYKYDSREIFYILGVTANLKCPAVDGVKCPKIDERAGQVTPS